MIKEKLIHWRNVHSPLLYDLARHIDGPSKYWDIRVKEMGVRSSKLERVMEVLRGYNFNKKDLLVIEFKKNEDFKRWNECLNSEKWVLSLRDKEIGVLVYLPKTEGVNLVLSSRLFRIR